MPGDILHILLSVCRDNNLHRQQPFSTPNGLLEDSSMNNLRLPLGASSIVGLLIVAVRSLLAFAQLDQRLWSWSHTSFLDVVLLLCRLVFLSNSFLPVPTIFFLFRGGPDSLPKETELSCRRPFVTAFIIIV